MSNKKDDILDELLVNQRKHVPFSKKLQFSDLKRICKHIDGNIFNNTKCCLWTGYITNVNNVNKGVYINFFFRKKKVALHRLLYINFVDDLNKNEYLKFNCANGGKCCNIHHIKKYEYNIKEKSTISTTESESTKESPKESKKAKSETSDDMSLYLEFD